MSTLLASASFARAYTLAVLGTVFSSFAIERIAGRVTYVTIIVDARARSAIGVLVARRRRDLARPARADHAGPVRGLGAPASVFWSSDVASSFWSWVSTAALAFLAIVIGHVRDTLQTARALGDVLRLLLSISLGLEVLSGVLLDTPFAFLGVQGNIAQLGPIQGIFGTRNLLGFVAVLALITFLVEYRTQSVRTGVSVASVVLAGGLAALSDSPTVLVLAIGVGGAAARSPSSATPARSAGPRCRRPWAGSCSSSRRRLCGAASDHRVDRRGHRLLHAREPLERDGRLPAGPPGPGLGLVRSVEPARVPLLLINFQLQANARERPQRLLRRAPAARLARPRPVPGDGRHRAGAIVAGCLGAAVGDLRLDPAHAGRAAGRLHVRELHAVGHRLADARASARCGPGKSRSWRERMAGAAPADGAPPTFRTIRVCPDVQGRILRPCPLQPTAPR